MTVRLTRLLTASIFRQVIPMPLRGKENSRALDPFVFRCFAERTRSQIATTRYLEGLRITPYTETRPKLKLEVPIFDTHQLTSRAGKDLF
jgi:hypothetical protein